jgi:acetoin utilization deacetylase AcuC-like enzyme
VTVAVFTHPACLDHDPGPYHPESPARLRSVLEALRQPAFAALDWREAPSATPEQLGLVHDPAYVDDLLALPPGPGQRLALDVDTIVGAGSIAAARHAAGAAVAAVDAVLSGTAARAFVAARPPGHHAERARAMGFCLFASAAIAARHAQAAHGVGRVAIVDFDVHHGNGTQDAVWNRPDLFYGSSHQMPCFPGTGRADERGASGNVVNAPLPPGAGAARFQAAWTARILPALDAFAPELLIVSAGFDAHRADPLAEIALDGADFAWITGALLEAAGRHAGGRIVSILEGGYDLPALAESCALHVHGLLQNRHTSRVTTGQFDDAGLEIGLDSSPPGRAGSR